MSDAPLLELDDLQVEFFTRVGALRAVDGVSLSIQPGETLGLVGESGSGKSVTARAIMRLVPTPPGRYTGGRILFEGRDLLALSESEMQRMRGGQIAMVFQDPMTFLNPVYTAGEQVAEAIRAHQGVSRAEAKEQTIELFRTVGIPNAEARFSAYPHELSGGLRQRVMISMALSSRPKLLIADEPTTALDVTIQAQILDLLRNLQQEFGMSILLITHDLGVVAEMCDKVAVMYAGRIVEEANIESLFDHPGHPYTNGLLEAIPNAGRDGAPFRPIAGSPPDLTRLPHGCRFAPRCRYRQEICTSTPPPMVKFADGHEALCHFAGDYERNLTTAAAGAI
jgi:oligopeptide/dipeptide ABC transporter ATP-binding protein